MKQFVQPVWSSREFNVKSMRKNTISDCSRIPGEPLCVTTVNIRTLNTIETRWFAPSVESCKTIAAMKIHQGTGDDWWVLSEPTDSLNRGYLVFLYLKQLFIVYVHKAKVSWFSRICLYQAMLSPYVVCHYRIWRISIDKLCTSGISQQHYPLLLLPVSMLTTYRNEWVFCAFIILRDNGYPVVLFRVLQQWNVSRPWDSKLLIFSTYLTL